MGSDRQLLRPSPKLARALARFPEQTVDFEKPNKLAGSSERQQTVAQEQTRAVLKEPEALTAEEQQLLDKYIPFYRDLETGRREPETEEQKHFVRVTLGQAVAETPHEMAYAKYMRIRDR